MKLPIKNLFGHIFSLAQNQPNEIALVGVDKEGNIQKTITYKELKKKIEYTVCWLVQNGMRDKDVLALAMPSSEDFLILSWACWSIGIITVPLDLKRDTISEHKFKLDVSCVKLIIAKEGIFTAENKLQLSKYKLIEIDNLDYKSIDRKMSWKSDLAYQALILFTSGTTAHPKGAQLSMENLVVNAYGIKHWFKITKNDRFLVALPLHHINSTAFCLATLLSGGSIAVVPNYSNSRFWQQLSLTSSTFTSIVPSICFDQLERRKEYELVREKIRVNRIQIGSAPVVISDVKKFMKMYGIPIYQGYGQTETSLRVTGVPLDLDKKTYEKLIDSNSIGKPMEWASVEILSKKGEILGEKEEGELAVKGKAVMKGYLHDAEAFLDGYFLTGDIGYYKIINSNRYFFLKGRKKEIIIKGGINISPVAVEDKLKKVSHDIDQVYVIGIDDKRYGEEVGAIICWKKKIDKDQAKINLKYKLVRGSEYIGSYETPQYLFSFDSINLPMTSTGKIQRSVLKKKINKEDFEVTDLIYKNSNYQFLFLSLGSPYFSEAFDLYNYCWDPLVLDINEFKKQIKNCSAIIALDTNNKVKGLILLIRTNISEKALSLLSYSKLTATNENSIASNNGESVICIAICSSNYKAYDIQKVSTNPTVEEVRKYLFSGNDGVYNFHTKPKGGFDKGASLIKLLPNARSDDKRSLGYNMLLKYPKITKEVRVSNDTSVATQLIEIVMLIARELGIENVYAFSRPAGLAKYFEEKEIEVL